MFPKHDRRNFVNHEVGHAVCALWLGLPVRLIRVDRDDVDYAGSVTIGLEPGREFEALLFAIAGPIAMGCPMQWPPSPDVHGDQQNAARFVARLGFTEQDWNDAHSLVHDIFRQPQVQRASSELFYRLLETPILDGDQARAIYDDACALGAA